MKKKDSFKTIFEILVGIAAIVACIAAVLVVPQFQQLFGNNKFSYQVRVQGKDTNEAVQAATVIIEVAGMAPLRGTTDSEGYARIFVDNIYADEPGRLRVEVDEYEPYLREMDINPNSLPDTIYLVPIRALIEMPPTVTATSTNYPIPTPWVTSTTIPGWEGRQYDYHVGDLMKYNAFVHAGEEGGGPVTFKLNTEDNFPYSLNQRASITKITDAKICSQEYVHDGACDDPFSENDTEW